MVQLYDAFTINTILFLEDLGFCRKGEGGAFVSDGNIAPGGELPVNTNGGGLSYCHPGMYGLLILIEGVRQLRGECGARQVQEARRRDGARQRRRAVGAGERDLGDGGDGLAVSRARAAQSATGPCSRNRSAAVAIASRARPGRVKPHRIQKRPISAPSAPASAAGVVPGRQHLELSRRESPSRSARRALGGRPRSNSPPITSTGHLIDGKLRREVHVGEHAVDRARSSPDRSRASARASPAKRAAVAAQFFRIAVRGGRRRTRCARLRARTSSTRASTASRLAGGIEVAGLVTITAATRSGNRNAVCSAIAPPTAVPASATFSRDAEPVEQRDQVVGHRVDRRAPRGFSPKSPRRACRSARRAAWRRAAAPPAPSFPSCRPSRGSARRACRCPATA